jgi:HD-like signal output (HDOD) protein
MESDAFTPEARGQMCRSTGQGVPQVDIDAAVQARVQSSSLRVPPSPLVAMRLTAVVARPGASLDDVADVLRQDQTLAAVLLRLANSAAYRRSTEVVSIAAAVSAIGLKGLQDVAWAHALHGEALRMGALLPLRRRAWRESLVSAQIAQWLAEDAGDEDAFVAGLLHDLGKVPVISAAEDVLQAHPGADTRTEEGWWALVEEGHVEAGRHLATSWALPPSLSELIARHHDPTARGPLFAVVRLADQVVRLLDGAPSVSAERLAALPGLPAAQVQRLLRLLPLLPAYLDAFREPAQAEVPTVIDYELQVADEGAGRQVTLHVEGLVQEAAVRHLDARQLVVQASLRVGQLVRVRAGEASFAAQVRACVEDESLLAPWALDALQQAAWERFANAA